MAAQDELITQTASEKILKKRPHSYAEGFFIIEPSFEAWGGKATRKVSHKRMFKTVYIEIDILSRDFAVGERSECKYLFEGIKFSQYCSFHIGPYLQLNLFMSIDKIVPWKLLLEGWSLIRLLKSIMWITWIFLHTQTQQVHLNIFFSGDNFTIEQKSGDNRKENSIKNSREIKFEERKDEIFPRAFGSQFTMSRAFIDGWCDCINAFLKY